MLSHSLLLHTALAGFAAAQGTTYDTLLNFGSPYGSASNKSDEKRFAQANLNPNVTKSFQFAPFLLKMKLDFPHLWEETGHPFQQFYVGGVYNDGSNAPDNGNLWTLRINVSDFAELDARPECPSEQPGFVDPHITNTVFELDWSGDDSLRSALNGSTAPFCVAMTTASFLPNVTDLFTEDNDSGDCEPVLGTECTNAILSSGTNLNDCSFELWEDLPECASTIGASRSYAQYGLARINTNLNVNSTAHNASYADVGYAAIADGTDGQYGFLSPSKEAYNATNTTIYEQKATRLYVMVMAISPYQGQFGLWSQKALCVRVNATQLEAKNGGSSGSSGGDGSCENAASALVPGIGSVIAFIGLGLGIYVLL